VWVNEAVDAKEVRAGCVTPDFLTNPR
jgi:hypothetical protein